MRYIIFILMIISLTGCITSIHSDHEARPIAKKTISTNDKFYIAVGNEGRYKTILYKGSNVELEYVIEKELSKYVSHIFCGNRIMDLNFAKIEAKSAGCNILIYSRILHWEDRATAWSGLSDEVKIRTIIYDLRNDEILDSFVAEGTSANITFLNDGPSDLLDTPYRRYFDSLFGN